MTTSHVLVSVHLAFILVGGHLCGSVEGCFCFKYKDISPEPTIFESSVLPDEQCCMASVGNGYLATVVYSDTVHMNEVYNGRLGSSHRARIPSTAAIQLVLPQNTSVQKESYALDVQHGVFQRNTSSLQVDIVQRVYAHQVLSRLLVNEIVMTRRDGFKEPFTANLTNNFGNKSDDVNFTMVPPKPGGLWFSYGNTTVSEIATSPTSTVFSYWTDIPENITLATSDYTRTWTYITSLSTDKSEALKFHTMGDQLAKSGTLFKSHSDAWQENWAKGRIDVSGDLELAKAVYGSMYYILSSLPPLGAQQTYPFQFYGINPASLAYGGSSVQPYRGHIFWDQETWMYPAMLMLHPELALAMLTTRTIHLSAARDNAAKNGDKGARYPWEMGYTGAEVCPAPPNAKDEIHINGDIAFAVQQYLYSTNDTNFLVNQSGFDMIKGLAEYWAGRSVYNDTLKAYTINNVMPPDEQHDHVNNSVYTNSVAQISLRLPSYAASLIGEKVPANWTQIADQMFIPYDTQLQYHPEYEGYKPGTQVKQADAILLGFPLMVPMNRTTRHNDLTFYETYHGVNVTNPNGPAMTWSMFTIGWLELGNETKAGEIFTKSYANVQQPYKIWTETAGGGGVVNFVTGMGGFLQGVIFGYGGMRLGVDSLAVNVTLPANTQQLAFTSINYLCNSLDVSANKTSLTVDLNQAGKNAVSLELVTAKETYSLQIGKPVTVNRQAVQIKPKK